jgi:tellurite resistance protein
MKFEQLLNHLDSGICVDQLQTESVVDLAVLLMSIDGEVCEKELSVLNKWIEKLCWNSEVESSFYISNMITHCRDVIAKGDFEHFIHHRMKHIVDEPVKELAYKLTTQLAQADGVVTESESNALKVIEAEL